MYMKTYVCNDWTIIFLWNWAPITEICFHVIHINDLHLDGKTLIFVFPDDTTLMNRGVKAKEVQLEAK